jgi:hypothetical protein
MDGLRQRRPRESGAGALMPIFEIESNGKVYEVEAPDAKSAADALRNAGPPSAGGGLWDKAKGLYNAADAGVASAVAGAGGLIGDIPEWGARGIHAATNFVEDKLGMPRSPGPDFSKRTLPTAAQLSEHIQQNYYGGAKPYKPQNTAEEYAKTGGEFLAGAMVPGGPLARMANVALPAIATETAGQLTKGTPAEPWARGGTALVSGGLTGAATRPRAVDAIRGQMPPGVTPQMVDDAERLIADANTRGINLSWPEALSQVSGSPVMTNTMRHLEAAPQTEARMGQFFAGRPQAVQGAARQEFDNVAPVNNAPSTIGPAVGETAENAINDVRGAINRITEPDYAAAATVRLTPQEMARVRALPGYEEARTAVRGDPQLNRHVANLPDDSVGFLNEVKKQLDQMGQNARSPVAQNQNMQRAAGLGQDAEAVRDAGTRASRDYAMALTTQTQLRQQYLEPLLQGPLGKIAAKDTTTKNAINALFPSQPLANSADEIATTVGALAHRNPRAARDLVRAHVEGTFNEAARDLQTGANQAAGAKFRVRLVGNPQQGENLEAAVRALPNGDQTWAGFNRFLDILEATGTRQNVGSRTAYNTEFMRDQAASGLVGEAVKGVTNPIGRGAQFLADRYERYTLGRNLNELADILTNPASANYLRQIAQMPVTGGRAQQVAAAMLVALESSQSPRIGNAGGQPRN